MSFVVLIPKSACIFRCEHLISASDRLTVSVCAQVPEAEQIRYVPFDIGYHSKQSPEHVLSMLTPILEMCLDGTGYFVSGLHANGAVRHPQHFYSRSMLCTLVAASPR